MVIYDDRADSVTKGQTVHLQIGRDNYVLVRIPTGVWYGFKCLSPGPALIANCTDLPHDPGESETRSPSGFGTSVWFQDDPEERSNPDSAITSNTPASGPTE